MQPKFTRVRNLEKDVISLYPSFYEDGCLYLVDEDGESENPPVVSYDIRYLLLASESATGYE